MNAQGRGEEGGGMRGSARKRRISKGFRHILAGRLSTARVSGRIAKPTEKPGASAAIRTPSDAETFPLALVDLNHPCVAFPRRLLYHLQRENRP